MVRRHGRRPVDPDAPVVDVDRVLADDSWIDEVGRGPWRSVESPFRDPRTVGAHRASGRRHRREGHAVRGDPLPDLFEDWRTELAHRPLPSAPVLTVRRPAPPPVGARRSRSLRTMLAVASAIGAVVVGSASIAAAGAQPDSPFWPITRVLLPDRAAMAESAGAVRSLLVQARAALSAGRTGDAQAAIRRAADELRLMPGGAEHDDMDQAVIALWVVATPPPGSTDRAGTTRAAARLAPSAAGMATVPGSATSSRLGVLAAADVPVAPSSSIGASASGGDPPTGKEPVGQEPASASPSVPAPSPTLVAGSSAQGQATPVGAGEPADATPVPSTASDPPQPTPTPPAVTAEPTTSDPADPTGSSGPGATEQPAPSPTATSSSPASGTRTPEVGQRSEVESAGSTQQPEAGPVGAE